MTINELQEVLDYYWCLPAEDAEEAMRLLKSQQLILLSIVGYFDEFKDIVTPTSFHPYLEAARKAIQ